MIDETRDDCWLSPISVWELSMLESRGRIRMSKPLRQWVEEAFTQFPVIEAPLNHAVALSSREISLPHPDPADRFLAATSLVYELVLITVDQRLVRSKAILTRSK